MQLGERKLTIEDVARVARGGETVSISTAARARVAMGRTRLLELLARGERIYGVNTGIGGNVGISLAPDQMELLAAQSDARTRVRHRPTATRGHGPRGHVAAHRHFSRRGFGRADAIGRGSRGAAEPGRHAGGSALRVGGRKRRPDALRLHRARLAGQRRGRIPRSAHARRRTRWPRPRSRPSASRRRKGWR